MRINIGRDSFPDNPRLDYNAFYGLLANEPTLSAWTAAPKPEVWLNAINQAAQGRRCRNLHHRRRRTQRIIRFRKSCRQNGH